MLTTPNSTLHKQLRGGLTRQMSTIIIGSLTTQRKIRIGILILESIFLTQLMMLICLSALEMDVNQLLQTTIGLALT